MNYLTASRLLVLFGRKQLQDLSNDLLKLPDKVAT